MDTNLKKSHKLTTFTITLIILSAALLVTMLYPRTGVSMEKLRDRYTQSYGEYTDTLSEWCIERSMVNYAVEASYYMYGFILQECENRAVDFSVLDKYGWDSDYHTITSDCEYLAVYNDVVGVPEVSIEKDYLPQAVETEVDAADAQTIIITATENTSESEMTDSQTDAVVEEVLAAGSNGDLMPLLMSNLNEAHLQEMDEAGIKAYLIMEFDAYGKLAVANMVFTSDTVRYYDNSVYRVAKNSVEQYKNNVKGYYYETGEDGDYYQVIPKNFKVVFLIDENSDFIFQENYNAYYVYTSERLYWETGVAFIIVGIALLVAVLALLLPFIKVLNTGWERIFCIHIETVIALGIGAFLGTYFMMLCMANTNMYEILRYIEDNGMPELLGYQLSAVTIYYGALAANFLGWAVVFFAEYIVVSAIRQFLCKPGYYLKNRFLCINILKWLFSPMKRLYYYVTDIDITSKLKNSILKIVITNFVLVTILVCMWFAGIPGVIVYSIVLYIVLKRYGSQLQKQYYSLINATKKMAEGDLKISLEEDLGVFTPFGEALTKIQQGFSKAVAEEAKSQQMKTELITNVSHDLKTPLTAIITYVNLLKNTDISEEEHKSYVETLDQKTQRLKVLIEDLFEVSKAQSGSISMNFMDVDVVSLMKQVRLEMEDQIADSDLMFRWNLPEEKIILNLDGQKTYRVFVNLIGNILKYSMPNSRVFIDLISDGNTVQICFRNISMAELDFDVDRLTDRFVRGDASRNTEGSGLGLAIAKSFVELQHGTFKIDVDGDLFKVTISWLR